MPVTHAYPLICVGNASNEHGVAMVRMGPGTSFYRQAGSHTMCEDRGVGRTGRRIRQVILGPGAEITNADFAENGYLATRTRPGVTTGYTYDIAGQMTSANTVLAGGEIFAFPTAYDARGLVRSMGGCERASNSVARPHRKT